MKYGRLFSICFIVVVSFVVACSRLDSSSVQPQGVFSQDSRLHVREVPSLPFDQAMYDSADLAWGGRLYDEWWSLADGTMDPMPPETATTHPLWPATNTSKIGATTWRCKSCHGWDYRGVDGIYGRPDSSYYTLIKGIIPIEGGGQPLLTTPEEIYLFLHDGLVDTTAHGLGALVADDMAFYALTKFVVTIQAEATLARAPSNFIDDATKLTTGIEASGMEFYAMAAADAGCVDCHGPEGKLVDFADGDPLVLPNVFVDTLARENPWEALHKIRFGQPGSTPAMMGLESFAALAGQDIIQNAINVVAFAQNGLVPSVVGFDFRMYQAGMDGTNVAQADLDFARGGILYDKWWTDPVETTPLVVPPEIVGVDHVLWTPAATNLTPQAGDVTWRCKSCHGWDYVGVDGAYGIAGGSYETGIKGIVSSNGVHPNRMEPVAIFDFLASGTVVEPGDHAFQGLISEMDLYALTRFTTTVQHEAMAGESPADFIDLATKTVPGGDTVSGQTHFDLASTAGGCSEGCHGVDGTLIDFADGDLVTEPNIFLAEYAQGNPWETLHKIRFGHPGSVMPGLTDYRDPTLGLMESVDILSYVVAGFVATANVSGDQLYERWISGLASD